MRLTLGSIHSQNRRGLMDLDFYPAVNFNPTTLKKEDKLIIDSLFYKDNGHLRFDTQGLDWGYILEVSDAYRAIPFLYRVIRDIDEVPFEIKDALRQQSALLFAKNNLLLKELSLVISEFNKQAIDVIVLKGAVLSSDIYSDLGLRRSDDADILIRKEDFDRVALILSRLGYQIYKKEKLSFTLKYRSQAFFVKDNRFPIDVHWNFMDLDRYNRVIDIDLEKIWRNKESFDIGSASAYKLGINDLLVYQCLHIAIQHAFQGLIWYLDIHKIIDRYKEFIDWDEFVNSVISYRIKKPVFYALIFTQKLFNSQIPKRALEGINPQIDKQQAKMIFNKLKDANIAEHADYILTPLLLDSFNQKMRFVVFESLRSFDYFLYSLKIIYKSFTILLKTILKKIN